MRVKQQIQEGEDFYFDPDGRMVLTETFHLKRGFCCGNKCRHCPYHHENVRKKSQDDIKK